MHFIFDANLSKRLVEALRILESGVHDSDVASIAHADQLLKIGATDEEIITEAGKTNAIIISQDDDFKRIRSNKLLLKELGVGFIMYKPPKRGARYWEMVQAFVIAWPKITSMVRGKLPPFIIQLNAKGELSDVEL
jgi:PIN like domain